MLHLPEAHRVANGKGVRVALMIPPSTPRILKIAGSVIAQFDVSAAPARPSRHGVGMAGAIAGHKQIEGGAPGAQLSPPGPLTRRTTAPARSGWTCSRRWTGRSRKRRGSSI